jgi:hypothetical protein
MTELNYDALLQLHIDAPNKKLEKTYGLQLAKSLQGNVVASGDSFFQKRYASWKVWRDFGRGTIDMKEFMDMMNIQGNKAYMNIDFRSPKIAPKFIEVMMGGFMSFSERPIVTAIDDISLDKKEKEKLDAKYRMVNKDQIAQMEQMAGVQLEDKNAFTPEDEDELTLYFDLEFRLPEEILFETLLTKILDDNQYPVLKRKLLKDIIEVNFGVTKLYRDANGNIRIRRCEPEYVVYNLFTTDNGMDELAYIGEYVSMKIIDIRRRYPNLSEETLFTLAQKSSKDPKNIKTQMWSEQYRWMESKPYDDYSVLVFDFEVRNTDKNFHVVKKDRFNNPNLKSKKAKPEIKSDKAELVTQEKQNIYHGVWVVDTEIMLEWGLSDFTIRPYQSVNEAMFSYSVICPNNDGSLVPSIVDRMTNAIRQMVLIRLKIQQLIAQVRPDEFSINISALRDLDIGLANTISPLEVKKIFDQTGALFYEEDGTDPDKPNRPPITPMPPSGFANKLQALRNEYMAELENLRAETGINEFRDGTNNKARMGVQVMQTQLQSSNNATAFIYEAFKQLMNDTSNKVCMMKWDDVVLKAKEYKDYAGYQMSVLDMTFQVSCDMLPTDEDRAKLEQLITTALSAQQLDFEQAFRVRQIAARNYKLAELYLGKMTKKNRKEAMEDAQRNAEINAKTQVDSAKAKAEGDAQLITLEQQGKTGFKKLEADEAKQLALINFATRIQEESFTSGKPLPPELKGIVDYVFTSILKDNARDQQQKDMQDQAMAEEQAAMEEQAMMEQEMGGEEMMEQEQLQQPQNI